MNTVSMLTKKMPALESMKEATAETIIRNRHAFGLADVWTADGWLITADLQESDGTVYFEARKDTRQDTLEFAGDDVLHFVPNSQTNNYGF